MFEHFVGDPKGLVFGVNELTGALVSLSLREEEFMHPGGRLIATPEDLASWSESSLKMFPVLGKSRGGFLNYGRFAEEVPSAEHYDVEYLLKTGGPLPEESVPIPLGSHGLPRHMSPTYFFADEGRIVVQTDYKAHARVWSTKLDREERFPFSFALRDTYRIRSSEQEETLVIRGSVTNTSDHAFRYQYGMHPAFQLQEGWNIVRVGREVFNLEKLAEQEGSFEQRMQNSARFESASRTIDFSHNLGFTGVWTNGNQFCVEPMTAYMREDANEDFNDTSLIILPGRTHTHKVEITPRLAA